MEECMKIVVLAGGISTERDVSFGSGKMVYKALKEAGHAVIMLDVYLGYEGDLNHIFSREEDWSGKISAISNEAPDLEAVKAMRKDGGKSFFGPNVITLCQQADVVFMALHGENGENGKLQGAFDLLGVTYTGTDSLGSALCMDKGLTKEIFASHGIPTPTGITLKIDENRTRTMDLPCVIKVANGGSSVGVYIVHTQEEYEKSLEEAFQYDTEVIIEQYIDGREFSVGVVDGEVYPIIEIAPIEGFYDYKNKYQAGSAIETCPACLEREQTDRMQGYAKAAFEALRLKSYARMDFMMNEAGEMFCLEANTLPGMTPTSLLPQEAKANHMSFTQLCEKIIDLAVTETSR